jgi:mannose/fructose-specific phosphotransferase system component IIA
MEKRIVVATHGRFSEGILTSMKMIFGDQVPRRMHHGVRG